MSPKDIDFITTIASFLLGGCIFYFLSKYIFKPQTQKTTILIVLVLAFINFTYIYLISYVLDLNPIFYKVSQVLSGGTLGIVWAFTMRMRKEKATKYFRGVKNKFTPI